MTYGRIVAAHARFNRIRQVAEAAGGSARSHVTALSAIDEHPAVARRSKIGAKTSRFSS